MSEERVFRQDTSWLMPLAILWGAIGVLQILNRSGLLAAVSFAAGAFFLQEFFRGRGRPIVRINRHELVVFPGSLRWGSAESCNWRAIDGIETRRTPTSKMRMLLRDMCPGKIHVLLCDGRVIRIRLQFVRREDWEELVELIKEYHARFR